MALYRPASSATRITSPAPTWSCWRRNATTSLNRIPTGVAAPRVIWAKTVDWRTRALSTTTVQARALLTGSAPHQHQHELQGVEVDGRPDLDGLGQAVGAGEDVGDEPDGDAWGVQPPAS